MTEDLAEWLLAQIAEDERVIRRNLGHSGLGDGGSFRDYRTYDGEDIDAADEYLEHFRPPRLLAECDTTRKVIGLHFHTGSLRDPRADAPTYDYKVDICNECRSEWPFGKLPSGEWGHLDVWTDELGNPTMWPCMTLRLIALPYTDRPGYREEWRP
jgi:hypothetical protein